MAKYEFCWTVSPRRPRPWQRTLEIDGLEVEVLGDRIVVRADSDDVAADELRIHAGQAVAGLVRAMSFHENRVEKAFNAFSGGSHASGRRWPSLLPKNEAARG